MSQERRVVDNIYRYSRRMSQFCVMTSYIDIRVANHLSHAFNLMKRDYRLYQRKNMRKQSSKGIIYGLELLSGTFQIIKKRKTKSSIYDMKKDPLKKAKNFAKSLHYALRKFELNRKCNFFKSFYDWDRERRMLIKIKYLNTKMFNRLIKSIFKMRLGNYFERIVRYSNEPVSLQNQQQELEKDKDEEFDRGVAFQMLMNLRKGGDKNKNRPFAKKSPKIAKPSRKLQIFIPEEDPTQEVLQKVDANTKHTNNSGKSYKIQTEIFKNNVSCFST